MKKFIVILTILSLTFVGIKSYANEEEQSKNKAHQCNYKDCQCHKADDKKDSDKSHHSCPKKDCDCKKSACDCEKNCKCRDNGKDCDCKNCEKGCQKDTFKKCNCQLDKTEDNKDIKNHDCPNKNKDFTAE